jgi:Uma2 family endonuclease
MAGASRKHNIVGLNTASSLNTQLAEQDCEVYANDLRVCISSTGLYTYPDVVVVCGEPQFLDEEFDTLLNPTLIVEVLSKSTKNFDRNEKFEHYRTLDSFREYLLAAQDKYHVEHYVRQTDGSWLLNEYTKLDDTIPLSSMGCTLRLADIYRKLKMVSAKLF